MQFDRIMGYSMTAIVALVLLVAPWLFGAWEAWYFWPFAGLIFLVTAGLGLRLLLSARVGVKRLSLTPELGGLVLCWVPFLAYALIRGLQAPVRMDAERSVLLHGTAFLLTLAVVAGIDERSRRWLAALLPWNLFLLGAYGIGNHFLYHNAKVLWVPGFTQYQQGYFRATGTYFCPDHFAGLMELGLCLAVSVMAYRGTAGWRRAGMLALAWVSVTGIILSKSRGGGIVLLVILVLALTWGLVTWSGRRRWIIRIAFAALAVCGMVLILAAGTRYMHRFMQYPWRQFEQSDRYQMTAAALRGWKMAPVFGVGPGMHQNIWPHIAATGDGDRARGIWPRNLNNSFHSYEAHNDWVQLLEEYGVAGFLLFLLAAGMTWRHIRRLAVSGEPAAVAALLALGAMAVHSLGDFNLQIPATTWLLALMVAFGIASGNDRDRRGEAMTVGRGSG